MDKETETETAKGAQQGQGQDGESVRLWSRGCPGRVDGVRCRWEISMGWLPEVDALFKRTTRRRQD